MDDAAAIGRSLAGEREAFRHLVERYESEALAHAATILGNREDARDAVQEAFLDAFRKLAQYDHSRRFYPWFYTILRHRCLKLLAARVRQLPGTSPAVEILARPVDSAPEDVGALEPALHGLASEERELLTLKYLDGLTYDELAQRLGIPRGTVMSRLYHARRRLRERVAGLGRDFGTEGAKT